MSQTIIGLDLKLTEEGKQAYQDVYNIVTDYTSSLRPTEFIYEEMKELAQIEFQFKEKSDTANYVCSLSKKMHYIPLEEVLNHRSLYEPFNKETFNSYL